MWVENFVINYHEMGLLIKHGQFKGFIEIVDKFVINRKFNNIIMSDRKSKDYENFVFVEK